jgi:hypothetical protein
VIALFREDRTIAMQSKTAHYSASAKKLGLNLKILRKQILICKKIYLLSKKYLEKTISSRKDGEVA